MYKSSINSQPNQNIHYNLQHKSARSNQLDIDNKKNFLLKYILHYFCTEPAHSDQLFRITKPYQKFCNWSYLK